MSNATIEMISPHGTPITLSVSPGDDTEMITALMKRADAIGQHYAANGWAFAATAPATPSAAEFEQGPTFAGFPCSSTVDDAGLPTWIIVNGRQAPRREKQGDVWYSVKIGDGEYEAVLRIPKGEVAPAVRGL